MSTVKSKTSIKIDDLINATVISGSVDPSGNLILETEGGALINAGYVGNGTPPDPLQLNNGLSVGGVRTTFNVSSPGNSSSIPIAEFVGKDTQNANFITVRYASFADNPGPTAKIRRAGISFKLSNEINAPESVKQFSVYTHSSQAYGNQPRGVLQADAISMIHNGANESSWDTWTEGTFHWNSGWGGGTYFTVGSTAASGGATNGVMLGNPHIPWRSSTGGSLIRFAEASAANAYWDIGPSVLLGNNFNFSYNGVIKGRVDISGNIVATGNLYVQGTQIMLSDNKRAIYSDASYIRINEGNEFPGGTFFGSTKVVIGNGGSLEMWPTSNININGGQVIMMDGSSNKYGGLKSHWTVEGNVAIYADRPATNTAVACRNVAHVMDVGLANFKSIHALAFTVQPSSRIMKKDLEPMESALKIVDSAPVYKYRMKRRATNEPKEWHIGPMADDMPDEVRVLDVGSGNYGNDLGAMIGILWAAIQELNKEVRLNEREW